MASEVRTPDTQPTPAHEPPGSREGLLLRAKRRLATTASVWLLKDANADGGPAGPDLAAIEAGLQEAQTRLENYETIVLSDPFIIKPDTDGSRSLRISSLAQGRGVQFDTVRGMYENEIYRLRGIQREQRIQQLLARGHGVNEATRIISAEAKDCRSNAALLGYLSKHIEQFNKVEELRREYDVRLPLGVSRIPITGPYNAYAAEDFPPVLHNVSTLHIFARIRQWQAQATQMLKLHDTAPSETEIDVGLAMYGAVLEMRHDPQALRRVLFAVFEQAASLEEAVGELWYVDYRDPVRGLELRETVLNDFAFVIRAIELEHEARQSAQEIAAN